MNRYEIPDDMIPLPHRLESWAVEYVPPDVVTLLDSFPQLFIAGGFVRASVRGERINDLDLFTTDLAIVDRAVDFYIRQVNKRTVVEEKKTPCTITITLPEVSGAYPVQFINNVAYESPADCLRKIDFTVCQAAVWRENFAWKTLCSPAFPQDVKEKRLVYTSPVREEAPGGSLWRAFKYAHKGYSITQEEVAKLVVRLNSGIACATTEINPWTHVTRPTHSLEYVSRSFNMSYV